MKTYLHYPMKTLVNCRDLGGLPTADGGVTRFGVLIRSELPSQVCEEDLALFRELNLTTSVDLRTDGEVQSAPSDFRVLDWIDYRHVCVMSRPAEMGSEVRKSEGPPKGLEGFFDMDWKPAYVGMISNHPRWIKDICEIVADAPGAVHFHCATGKDRTGLFAAVILSVCGCSADDIAANYSLSEVYMRKYYVNMMERMNRSDYTDEELSRGFFGTSQNTMRHVLRTVEAQYGSMVDYIRECGVSEETMEAIRRKLVEY